jgi:hypothetical protein
MHKLAAGTAFEGLYVIEKIPNDKLSHGPANNPKI